MRVFRTTCIGAALLFGAALHADAADLGLKDYDPAPTMGPSWYARIDGGYSFSGGVDMVEHRDGTAYDMFDTDLDDTWSLGGGIGRYLGDRFRADITYDHRFEADAKGSVLVGCCEGQHAFGVESDLFLFNLYYDFHRGSRFSPYIGAGVGFTYNRTTTGTYADDCGCTGTIEEGSNTDFAAALMAGFTMRLRGGEQVMPGIKDAPVVVDSGRGLYLDVGYRFLYLGDAETGAVRINSTTVAEDPVVEDITAHEIRVGLRYDFR